MRARIGAVGCFVAWVALGAAAAPARAALIYGLKSQGAGSVANLSTAPTHLYHFQEDGTGFVDVGAVRVGGADIDADGLAYARDGRLFGFRIAGGNSTLIAIDPTTAAATPIGSAVAGQIRGAVFDRFNRLFALNFNTSRLLRIDPNTGAVLSSLALSRTLDPYLDIAQGPDGTFYVSHYNNGVELLTLDINTGTLTTAHLDQVHRPGEGFPLTSLGLAFAPTAPTPRLFSYDANGTDDIFRYDLPNYTRSLVFSNIISSFNAGGGDLAALNPLAAVPEPGGLMMVLAAAIVSLPVLVAKKGKRGKGGERDVQNS